MASGTTGCTFATVGVVGLEVDTLAAADVEAGLAGELTLAVGANLTCCTLGATNTTVSVVGLKIDTEAFAVGEAGLARELALTVGANLARCTSVSALPTVLTVCGEVETLTVAVGGSGQTGASSNHTFFAALALDATLATVSVVGFGVHAYAGTVGGSDLGTTQQTLTLRADLTGGAGLATGATVSAVGLEVDTLARAVGLTFHTGHLASTVRANFTGVTNRSTGSAILDVSLKVDAAAGAVAEAGLAGEDTFALGTDLTGGAGATTSTTVGTV